MSTTQLEDNKYILRPADESDVDLLFEWANDPETRQQSFNSDIIPYDDHVRWFKNKLSDDNTYIFILQSSDDSLGVVRLAREADEGLISYSIASKYRGLGYGRMILELLEKRLKDEGVTNDVRILKAEVKESNLASRKIFEKLDYTALIMGDIVCYKKQIRH